MATRYSKDKYIHVKNLKNEPLSQLTPRSKKRKLDEGKDKTPTPLSLFGTPSSPTPPSRWRPSLLQPLAPKGRVRLTRVSRKILPLPLNELIMLLPTTSLEVSHPSLLTNWSSITFITGAGILLSYFLFLIEYLHPLKFLTLLFFFFSGSWWILVFGDRLPK